MQHRVSLEDRQREMAERIAAKRTHRRLARERAARRKHVKAPVSRWIVAHFVEVMERLIDDLGLDVPRREPKLTA